MIENDQQYRITVEQARKFEQALGALEQPGPTPMHELQRAAMEGQLETLRDEILAYDLAAMQQERATSKPIAPLIDICPQCLETEGRHDAECTLNDPAHRAALDEVQSEYANLIGGLLAEIARLRTLQGESQGEVSPGARIHKLKQHPHAFMAVAIGLKGFEFRQNDRDFQVGDILMLEEYDPDQGYTGRVLVVMTPYVLYGPDYGVPDGYCVMSIVPTADELQRELAT